MDGLQETLDTMATMRHFEALHRLTQAVDDMLGTSIKARRALIQESR